MSVTIRTPSDGERLQIPSLSSVSVGREGEVRIGAGKHYDPQLHGDAFWVADRGHCWELDVPERNHLEVTALSLDDRSSCTVKPGGKETITWPATQVTVCTFTAEHRVIVTMEPEIMNDSFTATGTAEPTRLDPSDVNDRALIVACADRLRRPGAPPLTSQAISDALADAGYERTSPDSVRQQLVRASNTTRVAVELHPAWVGSDKFTTAVLVDFLVATGSVTSEMLADTLAGPVSS